MADVLVNVFIKKIFRSTNTRFNKHKIHNCQNQSNKQTEECSLSSKNVSWGSSEGVAVRG
jgi:hypothetical protein